MTESLSKMTTEEILERLAFNKRLSKFSDQSDREFWAQSAKDAHSLEADGQDSSESLNPLSLITSLSDLLSKDFPPLEWLVDHLLPE